MKPLSACDLQPPVLVTCSPAVPLYPVTENTYNICEGQFKILVCLIKISVHNSLIFFSFFFPRKQAVNVKQALTLKAYFWGET